MKNRIFPLAQEIGRTFGCLLLAAYSAGFPLATQAATAFVEGSIGFVPTDTAVDSEGFTYVVGTKSSQGVLIKYDLSGGRVINEQAISGSPTTSETFLPVAMAIGSNDRIYLISQNKLIMLDLDGKTLTGSFSDSTMTFKDVAYFPELGGNGAVAGTVYVCGNSSGQAKVIKRSADLATQQASATFGFSGNTDSANSITLDDNGDVYVAGHLSSFSTGSFSTFALNTAEGWRVRTVQAQSDGIDSLSKADQLLAGSLANKSDITSVHPTINFGSGNAGAFGNDDPFVANAGDEFVTYSTGEIVVSTAGTYRFYSNTDDGARLKVDGTTVLTDDSQHGTLDKTVDVALTAGVHTVEFLQFEHQGAAAAELSFGLASTGARALLPAIQLRGNHGYVFKLSSDLAQAKKAYFSTKSEGAGGDFFSVESVQGWIYAAGYWQGTAENSFIEADVATGKDIELLKLDTDFRLVGRATVKGASDLIGHSITADKDGNVYASGKYGPGSADFIGNGDRGVDDNPDTPFTSLASAKSTRFVAKLNSAFKYEWVVHPNGAPPTFPGPAGASVPAPAPDTVLRWNEEQQRLFWTGSYVAGNLTLGQAGAVVTLTGAQGFIAVLEPDGQFTERVNLTIISEFGKSGTQVLPFGGTRDLPVTQPRIKGSQITASVAKFIYHDKNGNELSNPTENVIETQAERRYAARGYSLDNGVTTGTAETYTFTLEDNAILEFFWDVEFALTIDSDLSGTVGTVIGSLKSKASGNPDPPVKKHWIKKNELVIAKIDGIVPDVDNAAGFVRYIPIGYNASGPANTKSANRSQTDFFPFTKIENRQQVNNFTMDGPAKVTYKWKKQNGVQVSTTDIRASGLPVVKVTDSSGQENGIGTGTFWYDEHTSLKVGTLEKDGLNQLSGWFNGDGFVFASSGKVTDLKDSFTYGPQNKTYVAQSAIDLLRPVKVMWDYGNRVFEQTVTIGNSVVLDNTTITDPAVLKILLADQEPATITVEQGPSGSSAADMAIWDAGARKLYPLREGKILAYWKANAQNPDARVFIRVTIKYPNAPHYNHVANTPAVALDPDPNDEVVFKKLKYTENGATVDKNAQFTASSAGKTVLLFGVNNTGRGAQVETLRVRVVQTRLWTEQLVPNVPVAIGTRITSSLDTAQLGTGFVFFPNARYNVITYNREKLSGPIFAVNLHPTAAAEIQQLVVVWYERRDKILWPHRAEQYEPHWPTAAEGLNRIVIASRFGSESVADNGTDQIVAEQATVPLLDDNGNVIGTQTVPAETMFNPTRCQQVAIYNQPDRTKPGYNPNEEHALLAPSLRNAAVSPRPMAAYALRNNDLNVTSQDALYTSDPYVLVQFFDAATQEFKMKVYNVVKIASKNTLGALNYDYKFELEMEAGEPVIPFYPLPSVIGATPCGGTYGKDGDPTVQRTFWRDHKGTGWAISGDGHFFMYFYYPLSPDFYWPPSDKLNPGDCVAFLPNTPKFKDPMFAIDYRKNDQTPPAQEIRYDTVWPQNLPILKVGETLTFAGGEYRTDNPTTTVLAEGGGTKTEETPGLPGVLAWASGEIIFDKLNPTLDEKFILNRSTARLFPALEQRTVALPLNKFPSGLQPATKRTKVKNGNYVFVELSSSLQKRIFYDPLLGKLVLKGFLNDKDIGDPTLTAAPPAVYVLEPNILTPAERDSLKNLQPDNTSWVAAVNSLYLLSRNPSLMDINGDQVADDSYLVGIQPTVAKDSQLRTVTAQTLQSLGGLFATLQALGFNDAVGQIRNNILLLVNKAVPVRALGPGLALLANPKFLDPKDTTLPNVSYVTLAENNDESLGSAPVVLHIIKVDRTQRYRGAIKTILSDNVFDENIILRHTGDFAGNADDLVFEWWYRPEDGTEALTPDKQPSPNPWKLFADPSGKQGQGFYQLTLKGNPSAPEVLLADTLFFVRYRHVNDSHNGVNWDVPQPNGNQHCVLDDCKPGIPFEWAGAGNSSPKDMDGDGLPDYKAQLAEGWVKRVLDAVNPYEARIRAFDGDNPATYSSMIQQFGPRFEGPVALNPDKNVIENVGLIELYETILKRARDLSIDLSTPISTPGISTALQLASTRLSDFNMLLGNEAYTDALNPTIGFGSDSVEYGNQAPAVFAFQNQLSSLLEEELALLRGVDDFKARPVYNRLFWNFTKGEGEAAYAMNYNIRDVNNDGFINEADAMILYPQGHGDAWGDYLTAIKMQYDLLRHPYFNWVSRSESYNLQDIVIGVDFLDERKFAQVAAAKAKAGAEILNMTYRSMYVADPAGQWQGYLDTDKNRAWGVEEWARRAGQGGYFDWVTANALLPAVHPNTKFTGIQKVDRTTVQDIGVVAANLVAIQAKLDEANAGNNPLGLANDALVFDLDPTYIFVGSTAQIGTRAVQALTHFDQIFERALQALKNAKAAFDNANEFQNMIRQVANSEEEFRNEVFQQDLAYRNQLIEIFGTPYEGTIGAGRTFPAGYEGPDTMLYMYVDVREISNSTVPKQSVGYAAAYDNALDSGHFFKADGVVPEIDNEFRKTQAPSFAGSNLADLQANHQANQSPFYTSPDPNASPDSDGDPTNDGLKVKLRNLQFPVTAAGYTFQAPPEWGKRRSPGELQGLISQMVQAEADVASAIGAWDALSSEIVRTIELINARYDMDKRIRDKLKGQIAVDTVLRTTEVIGKVGQIVFKEAEDASDSTAQAAATAPPTQTPTAGLSFSAGDILSVLRAALKFIGVGLKAIFSAGEANFAALEGGSEASREISDLIIALDIDNDERNFAMKEHLHELQNLVSDEAIKRIEIFNQLQKLRELSDQYRGKVAEAFRLVQERTAFNKRVAAATQMRRYQDMTFRVSRNAALEKYRSAFDLAARYTYLAGTAYDYDTNLKSTDAGSPVDILADVVRQRTIGILNEDGQPAFGAGGLAEDLAWLKTNFDLLKTRMGLNNPQLENVSFSLRNEAFRTRNGVISDATWRQTLNDAKIYKDDLWQVPEFRRYCRPFAPESDGPQPGLVIPFETMIQPGKNFFGWPLSGADNTFDPSVYTTKFNSTAMWFEGYPSDELSATPRVYLVPVGMDVMTIPNSRNLEVRVRQVLDQSIPVPLPTKSANLNDPAWKPLTDSLSGLLGEMRRFPSFRAHGFSGEELTALDQQGASPEDGLTLDSRLVGRSVWNTRWLLIIPGRTLHANAVHGLKTFVNGKLINPNDDPAIGARDGLGVSDIHLIVNSVGNPGN